MLLRGTFALRSIVAPRAPSLSRTFLLATESLLTRFNNQVKGRQLPDVPHWILTVCSKSTLPRLRLHADCPHRQLAFGRYDRVSAHRWLCDARLQFLPRKELRIRHFLTKETGAAPFVASFGRGPSKAERRLRKCDRFGAFRSGSSLCESPITCDKFFEHRRDEFCRLEGFTRILCQDLRIGDQIAVQRGRQRDGELNGFVVIDRGEFQLGHGSARFAATVARS